MIYWKACLSLIYQTMKNKPIMKNIKQLRSELGNQFNIINRTSNGFQNVLVENCTVKLSKSYSSIGRLKQYSGHNASYPTYMDNTIKEPYFKA